MLNRSRDWFLLNTCFQAGNISLRASSKSSAQCGVYMYMAARNVYPNPPKVTADKRDTFVDMFQRIVMSTRSPCPENTTMVDEEDQEEQTCSPSLESPDIQAGANPSGSLPTGANLTKSKFMLGTRCSKALWLTEHSDHFQAVRDAVQQEKQSRKLLRLDGYVVEARAREFLVQQFTREMATRRSSSNSVTPRDHSDLGAIAVVTIKERRQAESIDATRCAIRNPSIQVIHEAAFAYAGLYVRVDVLRRDPDHPHRWQMYEIKSRVVPSANKIPLHMDLIEDLAVQFFVVSRSILTLYGIPIRPNMSPWKQLLRKVQLVLLNGEYTARADISDATRAEPSSSPPLFVSREYFPFVCHEEVAKYVSTKSTQLRAVTSIPIEKKELLDVPIGAQCTFRNFRCPMLQRVCQPDSTNSSAHSVFTIPRLSLDMKNMLWSAGLQSCTEPGFLDKARRALGSEAEATAMNSSAQLYVELLQEMGKHSATTHRGKYRSVKLNIPLSEGASSPSVADTVFFVHERDFPVVMKRLNEAAVNPAKVRARSKKPRMDSTNAVPCVPTRFYIDFETVKLPVPIWDGTRPWANIPFQVSLHVEEAQHPHGSVLRHYSYLHMDRGIDPRSDPRPALRNFLEPLLRHLWDTSTPPKDLLIAHYASFERNILVDLFQLDANQSKRLDQSIWDLEKMFRFTTGSGVTVYHPQLLGLSSLKRVQPILAPDLSYNPKGITNGEQATYSYRKWIEEGVFHQAAREHLEEYCTLDTLIMVRCVQNLMKMNAQLEAISE